VRTLPDGSSRTLPGAQAGRSRWTGVAGRGRSSSAGPHGPSPGCGPGPSPSPSSGGTRSGTAGPRRERRHISARPRGGSASPRPVLGGDDQLGPPSLPSAVSRVVGNRVRSDWRTAPCLPAHVGSDWVRERTSTLRKTGGRCASTARLRQALSVTPSGKAKSWGAGTALDVLGPPPDLLLEQGVQRGPPVGEGHLEGQSLGPLLHGPLNLDQLRSPGGGGLPGPTSDGRGRRLPRPALLLQGFSCPETHLSDVRQRRPALQPVQSTATPSAVQTSRRRLSLSRPRRPTSTEVDTLSTESSGCLRSAGLRLSRRSSRGSNRGRGL